MKLKATSLLLGFCVSVLAVAASPTYASTRATTAFNSFHVQNENALPSDANLCLYEDNGAVVNGCTFTVNLLFDLPIDHAGEKSITVQDYWKAPSPFVPFNCDSYVYTGTEGSSTVGTQITFTEPTTSLITKDDVAHLGNSMTVICFAVPPGEGVANLNWNP